jgi:hypothetical protein
MVNDIEIEFGKKKEEARTMTRKKRKWDNV